MDRRWVAAMMANNNGGGSPLVFNYVSGGTGMNATLIFNRADATTCATYIDSNGVIQTVVANVARTQYTGGIAGLLLEPSRVNRIFDSSNYSTSNWARTSITSAQNATGPDSVSSSASTLSATGAAASVDQSTGVNLIAGTSGALTYHVKVGTGAVFAFFGITNDAVLHRVWVNLSTGVLSSKDQAGDTATTLALANGWYRITLTLTATNTINPNIRVGLSRTSGATDSQNGDTALIYGVQCEQNVASPSSYIATTTAVTRAIDNARFALPTALTILRSTTFYISHVSGQPSTFDGSFVWLIGANAGARLALTRTNGGASYTLTHNNGSTSVSATVAATVAIGDLVELRALLNDDGSIQLGVSINSAAETVGTASAANTLASAWAANTWYLNTDATPANAGETTGVRALKAALGPRSMAVMRQLT